MPVAAVVVSVVIGGAIAVFVLYRVALCIMERRKFKSVPLPPVQPLAHHREMWSSANVNEMRGNDQSRFSYLDLSSSLQFQSADRLMPPTRSLIGRDLSRQSTPTDDIAGIRASIATSSSVPSSTSDPLVPPVPSFAADSNSRGSSSVHLPSNSGGEESEFDGPLPMASRQNQFLTVEQGSFPPTSMRRARSPSTDRASRRVIGYPRPASVAHSISSVRSVETTRSLRSVRSASTIRGTPHGLVEIILPQPLASNRHPYAMGGSGSSSDPSEVDVGRPPSVARYDRPLSVSDAWLDTTRAASPLVAPHKLEKKRTNRPAVSANAPPVALRSVGSTRSMSSNRSMSSAPSRSSSARPSTLSTRSSLTASPEMTRSPSDLRVLPVYSAFANSTPPPPRSASISDSGHTRTLSNYSSPLSQHDEELHA